MKKIVVVFTLFIFAGILGATNALNAFRINYVYVQDASGPVGACTQILYDYTLTFNGNPPVLRTASSIPLTVGCHLVSIYPDGEGDGVSN